MEDNNGSIKRCQGITASGTRCERLIAPSHTFCYSHDETRAKERKNNASKAAKAKHAEPSAEILEIRQEMRELAQSVRERKVTPGIGSVVNQILGNVLKTFGEERKEKEFADLAARLEEVEKMHQRKRDMPTDDTFNAGGGWLR